MAKKTKKDKESTYGEKLASFSPKALAKEVAKRSRRLSEKLKVADEWISFPQRTEAQWQAEALLMKLAVAFYELNGHWPKKLNLATIRVEGDILTANME